MVRGSVGIEHGASEERSGDRGIVSDGARIEHGTGLTHRACTRRADGMRVDRVGVGHIGQMSSWAWISGHSAGVNDGRSPGSKYDARLVSQRGRGELEPSSEQSRDGIGLSHGTWSLLRACELHREGFGGADGMRGDGMGIGDIGQVPGDAWGSGHTTDSDDSWGKGRERHTDMVGR
jgi:hypothetical protein